MNYCNIKKTDIADGEGVRVSLFVSGCPHHCVGCFNPETWDPAAGAEFDRAAANEVMTALRPSYIRGITLLGGEPMWPVNQQGLVPLLRQIKDELPDKDVWCYTGYVFDRDLVPGGKAWCDVTEEMLSMIDVLVDGPFVEAKRNLMLKFRGSENQRVIDMKKTLRLGEVTLYLE